MNDKHGRVKAPELPHRLYRLGPSDILPWKEHSCRLLPSVGEEK